MQQKIYATMHNAADYPDRTQAGVYMGHLERLTKYQKYFQKQKAPIQYNKLYNSSKNSEFSALNSVRDNKTSFKGFSSL